MTNYEYLTQQQDGKQSLAALLATIQTDGKAREEMRYIPDRTYTVWLQWLDEEYQGPLA